MSRWADALAAVERAPRDQAPLAKVDRAASVDRAVSVDRAAALDRPELAQPRAATAAGPTGRTTHGAAGRAPTPARTLLAKRGVTVPATATTTTLAPTIPAARACAVIPRNARTLLNAAAAPVPTAARTWSAPTWGCAPSTSAPTESARINPTASFARRAMSAPATAGCAPPLRNARCPRSATTTTRARPTRARPSKSAPTPSPVPRRRSAAPEDAKVAAGTPTARPSTTPLRARKASAVTEPAPRRRSAAADSSVAAATPVERVAATRSAPGSTTLPPVPKAFALADLASRRLALRA